MYIYILRTLSVCLSVDTVLLNKTSEQICMKFGLWLQYDVGLMKKLLILCGDLDLDPDFAEISDSYIAMKDCQSRILLVVYIHT